MLHFMSEIPIALNLKEWSVNHTTPGSTYMHKMLNGKGGIYTHIVVMIAAMHIKNKFPYFTELKIVRVVTIVVLNNVMCRFY